MLCKTTAGVVYWCLKTSILVLISKKKIRAIWMECSERLIKLENLGLLYFQKCESYFYVYEFDGLLDWIWVVKSEFNNYLCIESHLDVFMSKQMLLKMR